jgi:hypothetical protein
MRKYTLNRWNWSERAKKWVYVEKIKGKRVYKYRKEPPKEFEKLVVRLSELNKSLMATKESKKKDKIFKEMMILSQKMQSMR